MYTSAFPGRGRWRVPLFTHQVHGTVLEGFIKACTYCNNKMGDAYMIEIYTVVITKM